MVAPLLVSEKSTSFAGKPNSFIIWPLLATNNNCSAGSSATQSVCCANTTAEEQIKNSTIKQLRINIAVAGKFLNKGNIITKNDCQKS